MNTLRLLSVSVGRRFVGKCGVTVPKRTMYYADPHIVERGDDAEQLNELVEFNDKQLQRDLDDFGEDADDMGAAAHPNFRHVCLANLCGTIFT
jgi:hypothetical protein